MAWDRDRDSGNMIDEHFENKKWIVYRVNRLHQPFGTLLYACYHWKHFSFIHIKNWDKHRPNKKLFSYDQRHFVAIAYIAISYRESRGNNPLIETKNCMQDDKAWHLKTSDQTSMCMCVDKPVENALVKVKFRVT